MKYNDPTSALLLDMTRLVAYTVAKMLAEDECFRDLPQEDQIVKAKQRLIERVNSVYLTETCPIGINDVDGTPIRNGDMVKGLGEHEGQSEVFYGEHGNGDRVIWQPFSYLNDYNGNNYQIVKS